MLSSGSRSAHDRELIEAAERYGVGNIALAWLIVDYALLAAAASADIQASDEEVQQQVALSRGAFGRGETGQATEEEAEEAKRAVLAQKFLLAELDRIPDAEEVTNLEMMDRIRWTTASAADVVLTGDPAIDATPEEALAYLEWYWAWVLGK